MLPLFATFYIGAALPRYAAAATTLSKTYGTSQPISDAALRLGHASRRAGFIPAYRASPLHGSMLQAFERVSTLMMHYAGE